MFACPNSGELNRRGNQFPSVSHISLTLDDNDATAPTLPVKRVSFVHSYNQGEFSQEDTGWDRNSEMQRCGGEGVKCYKVGTTSLLNASCYPS